MEIDLYVFVVPREIPMMKTLTRFNSFCFLSVSFSFEDVKQFLIGYYYRKLLFIHFYTMKYSILHATILFSLLFGTNIYISQFFLTP